MLRMARVLSQKRQEVFSLMRCISTTQISLESQSTGEWVRKTNEAENMFIYGNRRGVRFSTVIFTLNSRKPISSDNMLQALNHLQRRFQPYQLTIRERDEELWFFKPKNIDIDFKVPKKGTPKEDILEELSCPFNEFDGPLWRTRLIPAEEDDPCQYPEMKKAYPFQYYLAVAPHHGAIDANSYIPTMPLLINVLDDILEGKNITDDLPWGEFVSCEQYEVLYSQCKQELLADPERLESLKKQMLRANKSPILLKGLPRPKVDVPTTRNIVTSFSRDVARNFIERCKMNGVTLGNGFQTVSNTALIELVQEAGSTDESYDISALYSNDMRRYMHKRDIPILGLHVRSTSSVTTLDKNVRGNFWENARTIQKINKDLIKNRSAIEQEVGKQLFFPSTPPEDFFNSVPQVTRDYGYNNIGNIKIFGSNRSVMVSSFDNYFHAHRFITPFYNQLYSYGGNLRNTISYATDWMSYDTATLFTDKITSLMEYYSQK